MDGDEEDEVGDGAEGKSTDSLAGASPQDQLGLPRELRRLFSPPGGLLRLGGAGGGGGLLSRPPLLPPPLPAPGQQAEAEAEAEEEKENKETDGDVHLLGLQGPGAGKRRVFFEEVVGELGRVHVTARDEAARTAKARARKRKQQREVRLAS